MTLVFFAQMLPGYLNFVHAFTKRVFLNGVKPAFCLTTVKPADSCAAVMPKHSPQPKHGKRDRRGGWSGGTIPLRDHRTDFLFTLVTLFLVALTCAWMAQL